GAFASAAEAMGAVHSTVNLALSVIPQQFLLPGQFIIACFISISMGTSMGTMEAVAPISAGLRGELGISGAIPRTAGV
ncbi:Na+/H+ antiporter NhaC family protein, partial [Bacillus sp. GbtcB15]|uniref:Na+/H+ antiporter NhaC family protein n=1 Tax=Bacillus sp. GbtcB15 TaxID=2824760 RepID=UPI0027D2A1FD